MLIEEAGAVKVSKADQEKYSQALRSWPFFSVLSDKFEAEDVVKCFRIEGAAKHPRPNILTQCQRKYNKLNAAAVAAYVKENAPAGKPGRRTTNGKDE